jgi:hypothetical protein
VSVTASFVAQVGLYGIHIHIHNPAFVCAGNRFVLSDSVCSMPNSCPAGKYLDLDRQECMPCRDDSSLCLDVAECQLVETFDNTTQSVRVLAI